MAGTRQKIAKAAGERLLQIVEDKATSSKATTKKKKKKKSAPAAAVPPFNAAPIQRTFSAMYGTKLLSAQAVFYSRLNKKLAE
eukprot:CAMPEP_0194313210 /NCGR_PEP_ID=MMETSP0171-20130528/10102_1 /TAXON_ID=218684 /ORGANISM="Corethron pennatum, Strain L29A3" /LENGTH=82 /DNA_ID=CAMNT_0039068063 /DNA_START=644 /DNA_END=892 /DNA_ORIENTATION=+